MSEAGIFECSLETAPLLYAAAFSNNGADYFNFLRLWGNLSKKPSQKEELLEGLHGLLMEIHVEKYLLAVLVEEGLAKKSGNSWEFTDRAKNKPYLQFLGANSEHRKIRAQAAAHAAKGIADHCDGSLDSGSATLYLSNHEISKYRQLTKDIKNTLSSTLGWQKSTDSEDQFEISLVYKISAKNKV